MPPSKKAMTLRLSEEQADQLELVANVDNLPVAEVVRKAIADHIGSRQQDEGFRNSLRERIERARRLLD
jgi:predicted transcriptional regulator